jgi:hypothetical protein
VVVGPPGRLLAVIGLEIAGGRILAIDIVGDPAKLRRVSLAETRDDPEG